MTDLLLELSPNGADLRIKDGDLALDETLATPILLSLFSDGRAPAGEPLPDLSDDPRGWWAEEEADPYGSLLWLLSREKLTTETANRARTYARAALLWLERLEIVRDLTVTAAIANGYLDLRIALTRGNAPAYSGLWDATAAKDWAADRYRVKLLLA